MFPVAPLLLLRADTFLPHGYCYLWNRALLFTHFTSDLLIGLSYVAISLCLGYLVYRARRDIPFSLVFIAFGLFIIACGGTHFMEILTLWKPYYWMAASVKVVTAAASVTTAIAMPFVVPRVMATLHDARTAEDRRVQLAVATEASQAKSQFVATMSHELRTPLNAIVGYADLIDLELCGPITPDQRSKLGRIRASTTQLRQLVDDVLDFERSERSMESLVLTETDVATLVKTAEAVIEPQAAEKGLQLKLDVPEGRVITTDADKLRGVLINILSNAVKYTETGEVSLSTRVEADGVRFDVRDTGIGIDPKYHARIFDPFWQVDQRLTRKVGGAGLGLSIVRKTLQRLGGQVSVTSAPGAGSTFSIRVPFSSAGDVLMSEYDQGQKRKVQA